MADSKTQLTEVYPDNIDARTTTTTGDKRLVVVIGDPATDAAVAPVSATLGLSVNLTAGTAAFGKLAANSGVDIGDVTLTAGTNLIGIVSSPAETSSVYNGATALTPKFAKIDLAATGTLVAAVAGKKIRVLALQMAAAGAVTVQAKSAAGGTALTGAISLATGVAHVLPFNPVGWFETVAAELLELALGGAVQVSGSLVYVEV